MTVEEAIKALLEAGYEAARVEPLGFVFTRQCGWPTGSAKSDVCQVAVIQEQVIVVKRAGSDFHKVTDRADGKDGCGNF